MKIVSAILVIVGIVHLVPLKGVLGGDSLAGLYGVSALGRDLELLLRHRAVLFGLLGAFLVFSAFKQQSQPIAVIAGFVSTFSFIVLSWMIGKPNELIAKVVLVDWIAVGLLIVAGCMLLYERLKA